MVVNIFSSEIQDSIIMHIPHSGTQFPFGKLSYFDKSILERDIEQSTDHHTNIIFQTPYTSLVSTFSRLWCDVERFKKDSMDDIGRGYFYTKNSQGEVIRNTALKSYVYRKYFKPYHAKFTKMVTTKLKETGIAIIIDCHSFNNNPLPFESVETKDRPDICIGTDFYHTPKHLIDYVTGYFKNKGYSVKINTPYGGTMVPIKYYRKNENVSSIMIEINKKLYMDDNNSKVYIEKIAKLNWQINEMLKGLN